MKAFAAAALFFFALAPIAPADALQESNKTIARMVFAEVLSKGNFELTEQFYDKDFRNHGIHSDATLTEDQAALKAWHQAFSDIVVTVRKLMAEDDLVTIYWVARGIYTGPGNGVSTGKKVELNGITIWRMVNGRIKEEWSVCDELSMLQQLGLAPGYNG